MTSGEGGGVAVNNDDMAERVHCGIDPCHFYWQGRADGVKPFVANGARATEITGALPMYNWTGSTAWSRLGRSVI